MGLIKNLDNSDFYSGNTKNMKPQTTEDIVKKGARTEYIDVDNIELDPANKVFNEFDEIEEIKALADSIKLTGLRTPPVVREISRNRYLMRSGERRLKAVRDILKWKQIPCVVLDKLDEQSENYENENSKDMIIFWGDNILQRTYNEEQRFRIYYSFIKKLEHVRNKSSISEEDIISLFNFSRREYERYKSILKNIEQDKLKEFEEGKRQFKDLKEIVELQKQENRRQEKLNESLKIYSQSQGNEEVKYYIDRDNNILYSVDEKKINKKIKYGIKHKDCVSNYPPQWLITNEYPLVEERKVAQTFLDKLAMLNNFEECTAEEYISLLNKSYGVDKSEDKEPPTIKQHKNDKKEKLIFPEIIKEDKSLDDEIQDDTEEDIVESKKNNLDNVLNLTNKKDKKLNKEENNNKIQNKENKKEEKNNKEIELIKNKYALSLIFIGVIKGTDKSVEGALIKNEDNTRYFIIPLNSKIIIKQKENNGKSLIIGSKAVEIEPHSIKIKEKGE